MTKKIFKSILAVCALTLVLGLSFVMGILYNYFGKQINTELRKEAVYLAEGVELKGTEYLEGITSPESRITYIDGDGTVLYDSEAAESSMENHGHREEVMEALKKGSGHAVRMSSTLRKDRILCGSSGKRKRPPGVKHPVFDFEAGAGAGAAGTLDPASHAGSCRRVCIPPFQKGGGAAE